MIVLLEWFFHGGCGRRSLSDKGKMRGQWLKEFGEKIKEKHQSFSPNNSFEINNLARNGKKSPKNTQKSMDECVVIKNIIVSV